jgi:hypothetical protein
VLQTIGSRTVVEGFWQPTEKRQPGFGSELKRLIASWPEQHPLAHLLQPLCPPIELPSPQTGGNFSAAMASDPRLASWVERAVTQDWQAFAPTVHCPAAA